MVEATDSKVNASPVKSFFVSMLTRDIKLEEAILDLLDNCVDGILRGKIDDSATPYEGRWAEIAFDKDSFSIADNCGGIPWELSTYAFRMGRDPARGTDAAGVVGVYGIGMKRAIFKMGKSCLISTRSEGDEYEVDITPEWIDNEFDWDIPVRRDPTGMNQDGTTIVVGHLHEGVSIQFGADAASFTSDLMRLISTHYAFIIQKGFTVKVNGTEVSGRSMGLIAAKGGNGTTGGIRPYIYQARTHDDVEVFLTVGFTRPIPSLEEVEADHDDRRRSTEDAGWTVICNDRAVLYCDKSELTGWGEDRVPRYHTQFIAVSGIVEFKCDDPSKLPTTTTKRGVDASSILYLQAKNRMREGMKMFTDYTNRWKGQAEEIQSQFGAGERLSFMQIKDLAADLQFSPVRRSIPGATHFRPSLPSPPTGASRSRRIAFSRDIGHIETVADHLFGDPSTRPSEVGAECFDIALRRLGNEAAAAVSSASNKAVDRFVFFEAVKVLGTSESLSDYTYYGMGGPYLEDFRVLYELCNDVNMVSIENMPHIFKRQLFHRPCRTMDVRYGDFFEFIDDYDGSGEKSIFWLDFTDLKLQNVEYFGDLLRKVSDGSIVKVTLLAGLGNYRRHREGFLEQFDSLRPNPGARVPREQADFAREVLSILQVVSQKALPASLGSRYQPITSFYYADGAPMVTLTGVVCSGDQCDETRRIFEEWEFVNFAWNAPHRLRFLY